MTGIENHHKRNATVSLSDDLGLIGAVLRRMLALLLNKTVHRLVTFFENGKVILNTDLFRAFERLSALIIL